METNNPTKPGMISGHQPKGGKASAQASPERIARPQRAGKALALLISVMVQSGRFANHSFVFGRFSKIRVMIG